MNGEGFRKCNPLEVVNRFETGDATLLVVIECFVWCRYGLFDKLESRELISFMFFAICICDGDFLKVLVEHLSLLVYCK